MKKTKKTWVSVWFEAIALGFKESKQLGLMAIFFGWLPALLAHKNKEKQE